MPSDFFLPHFWQVCGNIFQVGFLDFAGGDGFFGGNCSNWNNDQKKFLELTKIGIFKFSEFLREGFEAKILNICKSSCLFLNIDNPKIVNKSVSIEK